jgi:hypothetical protein
MMWIAPSGQRCVSSARVPAPALAAALGAAAAFDGKDGRPAKVVVDIDGDGRWAAAERRGSPVRACCCACGEAATVVWRARGSLPIANLLCLDAALFKSAGSLLCLTRD